jgi:hypothetical protein
LPVLLARHVITTREKSATEQEIIAEQQATQAVFTGCLDRSVLCVVLAHMEMLGLPGLKCAAAEQPPLRAGG